MKKLTVYCSIGIHLAFLLLVVFGGALAWWSIGIAYIHLPALIWAIAIELLHSDCPLTVWENRLRQWANMSTYQAGFVEHYLFSPFLGPARPPNFELVVTLVIVGANILSYLCLFFPAFTSYISI